MPCQTSIKILSIVIVNMIYIYLNIYPNIYECVSAHMKIHHMNVSEHLRTFCE